MKEKTMEMHKTLDLNFIRSQFQVFGLPEGRELVFFENAGGSYVPNTVVKRLTRFFIEHKVQPYGASAPSRIAGEEMEESYNAIAELINAEPDELTIGPSTTLNFYVLAQSIREMLDVGDEIIVTNQDHEANIGAWCRLSKLGIAVREWRIRDNSGELDLEDLKELITDRTKVICCTLCSNIVGTHNDIKSVVNLARQVGAIVVADGVSYAPHVIPDVKELGVDFYGFSAYKTFGTHQGILWGSRRALQKVKDQGHFFNASNARYRLNPTGPQHAEIAALAGITEYFDSLYKHHFGSSLESLHSRSRKLFSLIAEHETSLANKLLNYLKQRQDVQIIGRDQAGPGVRASTIAFRVDGVSPATIEQRLAKRNIAVGSGDFYAPRCLKALGIHPSDGVVRVSMVHYNTEGEVEKLQNALEEIL